MAKPPIIGFVMAVAGVAVVVFLALLFFSDPGARKRTQSAPKGLPPAETLPDPVAVTQEPKPERIRRQPRRPIKRSKHTRRIKKAPPPEQPDEPPPLKAVFTVKDTQPPRLRVITPRSPAYLMTDMVTVRARSEAGAHVWVDGRPFLETATGVYVAKVNLLPGLNRLKVTAADAVGNTTKKTLQVTYINPSRIHQVKDNLMSMLKQLEEIKRSVDDVDARTEEIINAIADTEDADRVNELSKNLREIRKTKRTLEKEIETAFTEINALLARQ